MMLLLSPRKRGQQQVSTSPMGCPGSSWTSPAVGVMSSTWEEEKEVTRTLVRLETSMCLGYREWKAVEPLFRVLGIFLKTFAKDKYQPTKCFTTTQENGKQTHGWIFRQLENHTGKVYVREFNWKILLFLICNLQEYIYLYILKY